MKAFILLCICTVALSQTFDFTKYYGTYYLDSKDTKDCEDIGDSCCIRDQIIVSASTIPGNFTVRGNYTLNTYTICGGLSDVFTWSVKIIDANNGRTTIGIQSPKTAQVGFDTDDDGTGYYSVVSIFPNGYNFQGSDTPTSAASLKLITTSILIVLVLLCVGL